MKPNFSSFVSCYCSLVAFVSKTNNRISIDDIISASKNKTPFTHENVLFELPELFESSVGVYSIIPNRHNTDNKFNAYSINKTLFDGEEAYDVLVKSDFDGGIKSIELYMHTSELKSPINMSTYVVSQFIVPKKLNPDLEWVFFDGKRYRVKRVKNQVIAGYDLIRAIKAKPSQSAYEINKQITCYVLDEVLFKTDEEIETYIAGRMHNPFFGKNIPVLITLPPGEKPKEIGFIKNMMVNLMIENKADYVIFDAETPDLENLKKSDALVVIITNPHLIKGEALSLLKELLEKQAYSIYIIDEYDGSEVDMAIKYRCIVTTLKEMYLNG